MSIFFNDLHLVELGDALGLWEIQHELGVVTPLLTCGDVAHASAHITKAKLSDCQVQTEDKSAKS